MLFPITLLIAMSFKTETSASNKTATIPWFLVAFCIFMLIHSLGVVPESILNYLNLISKYCLVAALAGLGMKTSFSSLKTVGIKPFILVLSATLMIASMMLTFSLFLL